MTQVPDTHNLMTTSSTCVLQNTPDAGSGSGVDVSYVTGHSIITSSSVGGQHDYRFRWYGKSGTSTVLSDHTSVMDNRGIVSTGRCFSATGGADGLIHKGRGLYNIQTLEDCARWCDYHFASDGCVYFAFNLYHQTKDKCRIFDANCHPYVEWDNSVGELVAHDTYKPDFCRSYTVPQLSCQIRFILEQKNVRCGTVVQLYTT